MGDWACYVRYYSEDTAASVVVDLDAQPDMNEGLTQVIRATLFLNTPDENGFPSDSEEEKLVVVEDEFEKLMLQQYAGSYVGRVTVQGKRIMHAYLPESATPPQSIELGTYRAEIETFKDAEWDMFYTDIFPAPDEYQIIMNHRMIEQIEEQGEDITRSRETEHVALFDQKEDSEKFCSAAKEAGFSLKKTLESEGQYIVQLGKFHSLTHDEVDSITLELISMAEANNGVYDGWESEMLGAEQVLQ